jgi:hypothetical protein
VAGVGAHAYGLKMASRGQRAALLAIAAALAAYVALHSPLRDSITEIVGFERTTCYFCEPAGTGFQLPDTLSWSELSDSLAAAALLLLACLGGWAVSARFEWPAYERALVFGFATVALVTVPAAAIGALGSLIGEPLLRPPGGLLLTSVPSLVVVGAALLRGWRPALRLRTDLLYTPLLRAIALGVALLLVAELVATLLHPPTQGDALSYHAPLGVLFWSDGDLTSPLDRSPETWGLAHPGTAELWFGVLDLLGGEPLANLGQLPFAFLGAAAVYAFTRRTGLLGGAAMLAALAFLLMPMVALQVGTQANDLAGAALFMAAVALACAPAGEWRAGRIAMIGLALGLTGATKLALLPSVAAVGAFVLVVIARSDRLRRRHLGTAAAVILGLAFLAVVIPWWARNVVREGNPIFPQELPVYGHGFEVGGGPTVDFDYVERKAAWPFYPLLEPIDDRSGFGALLAIAIVPGLVVALRRARRQPLVLYGSSLAVTLVFWWIYSLHEPRFLLPYAGLALALLPWTLLAVRKRWRGVAAGLVVCAAAFSIAVTAEQQIVPLARQPVERAAFYDSVYGVDPEAQSLPEDEPVLVVTGYGHPPIDYTSYYAMLGPSQDRLVPLLDFDPAQGSTKTLISRMEAHGVRYAYVQALPAFRDEVKRLFPPTRFRLVRESAIVPGERLGVRRTAYRPATPAEADESIRRYLFELRAPDSPA